MTNTNRRRRLLRWMIALGSTYALWFVIITLLGTQEQLKVVDCVIIPGARVLENREPGPSLRGRLERALELYHQGQASHFVCTGGRGESGVIESVAAKDYLVNHGVPEANIAIETMSHTTWENFVFAKPEMAQRNWKTSLVVTDPFHMQRCLWMAQELGLEAHPVPSFGGPGWEWKGMIYYTTREMAAWLKYGADRAGRRWYGV